MKKFTIVLFVFFASLSSITLNAITCSSACSGTWGNASTWSPSGPPSCGDSIVICASDTVDVTTQLNYSGCGQAMKVVIKGMMRFFNGNKLRLPCGSYVLVYPGGSVHPDVGFANSNLIEICGVVEWNSNTSLYGPACMPPGHPFCQNVLPVELLSFKAEPCRKNMICLNWETITENNNAYYEVERSADALNFYPIHKIASQAHGGNSYTKITYSAVDDRPLKGINYYRLKQVDTDQSVTNSQIITAHMNSEKGIQFLIFPSVNSGEFTAQISGLSDAQDIKLLLRDVSGQVVYKTMYYADSHAASIRVLPGSKLPNGVYFCSFTVGGEEHVMKVIVINS